MQREVAPFFDRLTLAKQGPGNWSSRIRPLGVDKKFSKRIVASLGEFLDLGDRLVAVTYKPLQFMVYHITEEGLKKRRAFHYEKLWP
jgi:hypothetical protein